MNVREATIVARRIAKIGGWSRVQKRYGIHLAKQLVKYGPGACTPMAMHPKKSEEIRGAIYPRRVSPTPL